MKFSFIWLIIFVAAFLYACNNSEKSSNVTEELVADSTEQDPSNWYIWEANPDSMTKTKNPYAREGYYNVDALIQGLNYRFSHIHLKKVRQSADTLFTRIDDATYLTQRMGSSGAELYKANVYFNLSAVPGIKYIYLDFEEGDHARPGLLQPVDYEDYKEVK